MKQFVKITSKKQITIPSKIFSEMGLTKGDYLIFEKKGSEYAIKSATNVMNKLSKSINVDDGLKGIDLDDAIKKSKLSYFDRE